MSLEHSPGKGRNYRRAEASDYLKSTYGLSYTPNTLAKLAVVGGGPAFHPSRFPLYPQESLDAFARRKMGPLVSSTAEAAARTATSSKTAA